MDVMKSSSQGPRELPVFDEGGVTVGRVLFLDPEIQIRRKILGTDAFETIGSYERLHQPAGPKKESEWSRKAGEVEDVFHDWSKAFPKADAGVTARWTDASADPSGKYDAAGFMPRDGFLKKGSALVRASNGTVIARIYKRVKHGGAVWFPIIR